VPYERYFEAVDYLQRRLWHELPIVPVERALQRRVRQVLAHLDDPHLRFPVVHVGGSAGKGSTTAIAAAILRAAGHRTGMYTSPHLQTFIERYDVDGTLIDPDRFAGLVLGLDPLVRKMHLEVLDGGGYGRPALVEVAFATGMRLFADERCDAAAVEVGLGGRTDCTNVFDDKPATVITNVEFEHTERLGATRASIAREKAALIRGREVFVTGERHPDALAVLEERCVEVGATPWRLGREIRLRRHAPVRGDGGGERFDLACPPGSFRDLRIGLTGEHQARNAALAVAASLAFAERTGLRVTEDHVRTALAAARIPGRMELVQDEPRVLLDSAHNPVEARALAMTLRSRYLRRGVRLHLVCGILADKDQPSMVRALASAADTVIVTQPALVERIGDPGRMLGLFRSAVGARNVAFVEDPARAFDEAVARARPRDLVVVTGSMFLVGALRARWMPELEILRKRSALLRGE
jgi:dihydrofolate synthase/folylpolyglutamate synthase